MRLLRPLNAVIIGLLVLGFLASAPFLVARDPGSSLAPALFDARVATYSSILAEGTTLTVQGYPARVVFDDFSTLDPDTEALLILEPSVGYSAEDLRSLRAFLDRGGRVLIADDGGIGVDALRRLDLGIALQNTSVYSPSFEKDPRRILSRHSGLVIGLPTEVTLTQPVLVTGGTPLLLAPPLSWIDQNSNQRPELGEILTEGAFAAWVEVGDGLLIVVGDPDALARASPASAGPFLDLLTLLGRRTVVLDEAHRGFSDPLSANALLAGRPSPAAAIGILMTTAAVAAFMVLAPRLKPRPKPRRAAAQVRGVDPHVLSQVLTELQRK